MEKMNTKERIAFTALRLFSEKGYDGVGIELLAKTVGIKGASIYAHYKGKEDILNAIIDILEKRYGENFGSEEHIDRFPSSLSQFKEDTLSRIEFVMKDPQIQMIRRLCAKEQFRNEKLAALTSKHQLTGLQNMYTKIFEHMMEQNLIRKDNASILALQFIAPASLMIAVADRQPEREAEMLDAINAHIEHFLSRLNT